MAGPGFTALFGGGNIYQADPSFLSLNPLTANVVLSWPIEQSFATPNAAKIIEVAASVDGLTVQLSDATQTTSGYTTLFNNVGAHTFTVLDAGGNVLASIASGTAWQLYLADNSTVNGVFRVFQFGAGVSNANAAALAGAGLVAITTTLNEQMRVQSIPTSYFSTVADRASVLEWVGGTGNITLPDATTVGANWFAVIKNNGSGVMSLLPQGAQTIDLGTQLNFQPNQSAFIITDGTNWFSVGYGQQINSIFDFIQIDLTAATGTVVLAGAQLNRISYKFIGALAGNVLIQVPGTIQQYWVDNETTGAFSLTFGTGAGTTSVVTQSNRAILYCDGTNVVAAQTSGSISFADGSVATPGINFTADPATGFYRLNPHTIAVSLNGVNYLKINSTAPFLQVLGATSGTLLDLSPDTGTFVATLLDCTTAPTANVTWVRYGKIVILTLPPAFTATSNNTAMRMSGIPAALQPPTLDQWAPVATLVNNNIVTTGPTGVLITHASNTMAFTLNGNAGGFTAANAKGTPPSSFGVNVTYWLL